MALIQQIIVLWICSFVFLVLLALHFDGKLNVVWYIIFIPLFFLDLVQLLHIFVRLVLQFRNGRSDMSSTKRKGWDLFTWFCLACFQVLLCLYLDGTVRAMKMYYVVIPLLIVLVGYSFDLMRYQVLVVKQSG